MIPWFTPSMMLSRASGIFTFASTWRFDAPNAYKAIATLDLDGDGKMEVVIDSHYYEGGETTIYRCDPKKVEALLSVACGA